MANHTAHPPHKAGGIVYYADFLRRFGTMVGPFWHEGRKWRIGVRVLALVLLTCAQVAVQLGLNFWAARVYNAIELRSFELFLDQLFTFAVLLLCSMAVFSIHLRIKRDLQFGWRIFLSKTVLESWMDHGRHYQLAHIPGEHNNPDGRIAEDIRIATESAIDLALSLLYCVLLFVSFSDVLWSLSGIVHFSVRGMEIAIPGHLLGIAVLYAIATGSLALWVGRPLVPASDLRQTVEADFRFGLGHAREYSEPIALIQGDADERERLINLLRAGWARQTGGLTRIVLFTSAYSVLATPLPVLIAAPRYIMGLITLGTLMQTAQAFSQVASSLSWPVDNLATIAQWRASVERVLALQSSLAALDEMLANPGLGRIRVGRDGASLKIKSLRITQPDGIPIMRPLSAEIALGEHVLIEGPAAIGRKLMMVVAGLWLWGEGEVLLPENAQLCFVTDKPYLPSGTLAGAVCYPADQGVCTLDEIVIAMRRVGLTDLLDRLYEDEDWAQVLPLAQQQRLSFARLLLHRPNWIIFVDATNALSKAGQREMADLLRAEFSTASVLAIGIDGVFEDYFKHTLIVEE